MQLLATSTFLCHYKMRNTVWQKQKCYNSRNGEFTRNVYKKNKNKNLSNRIVLATTSVDLYVLESTAISNYTV